MRIVLRHLLESPAPPTLLLSNRYNGGFWESAADHVVTTHSRASHFHVPTVRIGHFFSRAPQHPHLSVAVATVKEIHSRRAIEKKRLKYFLVEEVPAETKTVHLIFNRTHTECT